MTDVKQAKRDVMKLLARLFGEKLTKAQLDEVLLNRKFGLFQDIKTIISITHTETSFSMQEALNNAFKAGLSKAVSEFTEITQIGAFLQEEIPKKEAGTFGGEYDSSTEY